MPLSRWMPRSGKCPCTCADAKSNCVTNPSSGQSWRSGTRRSSPVWVVAATKTSTPKPMAPPIMNAEKPSLSIALKTLWGAAEMPFGDACAEPFRHPAFEELTRRLQQLCEIGASGLLHGPNGIGKSYLCGCFTDKLPEKRYKILSLAHSSLTGSDLIRSLCRQLGVQPQTPQRQRGQYPRCSWSVGQSLAAAGARRSPELLGQCTGRSASVDLRPFRYPATFQSASDW